MIKPLEYYFEDGSHIKFNKYTIDIWGIVRNKKSDEIVLTCKDGQYNIVSVYDDEGKRRKISIGRAITSTFEGPPPSPKHTADHINQNPNNDTLENLRWLCQKGQKKNRSMPETQRSAFIIIKNDIEKTLKEWVDYLKDEKNHMGREYTIGMINQYAKKRQHGFAYKEYPDLPEEVWKEIAGSANIKGRWEISDMCRVKYITNNTENILSEDRLSLIKGYPTISINKRHWPCHILSFLTFFPEEYVNKKSNEMVLHEDDNKLDFRPHKLRLGTPSENTKDAHNNGSFDGKKSMRTKCTSYINGNFEQDHESQADAVKYLKSIGYDKATQGRISEVLNGHRKTTYDRTWKLST